jgi:two-component sensor histidine kinase
VEGAPGEVRISGISCSLVPRAAEAVGMALHELATNSLKYGALSVKGGHVEVRWSCLPGTNTFEIRWQESGGPEVIPPTRQGFGTTLIRDVPRHNLGCEVNLDYNPAGVCWSLRCDECVLVKPVCTTGA